MKKVVIIGDLFLDVLPSLLSVNKEKILEDGETFVDNIVFQRGGCAANFASVFATLMPEAKISFISKVGSDPNGDFLISQLKSSGISTEISKSEKATPVTIAISFKDGQRHFISYNGAMDDFYAKDIDLTLFDDANFLIWRGIWFAPHLIQNAEYFLSAAKERNTIISIDIGFDPFWNNSNSDLVKQRKICALNMMQYIDILFANEIEIINLTDKGSLNEGISKLFELGVKTILVHKGKEGSIICSNNSEMINIPAFPEKHIINPVGTGDTYDAAFIYRILKGDNEKDAAIFASQAASYSLSNPPGTPITNKDVEIFVKNQNPK